MLVTGFDKVTKRFGAQVLLEQVSFQLSQGQKVGLIGPNGSGKTTLLEMLVGAEAPTEGKVIVPKGVRVGYVRQYVEFDEADRVMDSVLADHRHVVAALREREAKLAQAGPSEMATTLQDYERAREAYDHIDGDRLSHRAKAMLDALGLAGKEDQRVQSLSGGEKNVVSMARALLARPDLLVLDEPGNHLDYLGIAWLEDFLRKFAGAVLIVSHNRYLLDEVVEQIFHLEDGNITAYDGNYSTYRATRLRQLVTQQAAYAADQKHLARLEAQVKRLQETARLLGDKASGKRYRAMRSRFERERASAVEKPSMGKAGVEAAFSTKASHADIALQLRGYERHFGERVLLEGASLDIAAGERVALVGPNGSGKTTLLRDIVSQGGWENENIRIGPSLELGYGSQEQEQLRDGRTILDEMLSVGSLTREAAIALLARFLFDRDQLHKHVEDLSGGERNRLQLAQLMVKKPNFLILDEPTNHLDIQTCEAVEGALEEYEGTLLVVSHDRYFLDKVVDRVVEVRDRKLHSYAGNFTHFWQERQQREARSVGRVTKRRKQRERTPNQAKVNPHLAAVEQRIASLEADKIELESKITGAFSAGNHQEGRRLSNRLQLVSAQLEEAYGRWMEVNG